MGKRLCSRLFVALILIFMHSVAMAGGVTQSKVGIFNFNTLNLEASVYGTTVTNMLASTLKSDGRLDLLDRKELESFLMLNELRQDDALDNVVLIGSRLGLDVIIVGSVEKRGSVIAIVSRVINIDQKRLIFSSQVKAFGDAGLASEIGKLGKLIAAAITSQGMETGEVKPPAKGPVNLQKRSGSGQIQLSWEEQAPSVNSGYEVFRGSAESGPYSRIAQVSKPEYLDQSVEHNTTYFYKVRSLDRRGTPSEFSSPISAMTALAPNPPVILRADGRIRTIHLVWSPNPMRSEDPLQLKGYKVYRAKMEQGPYQEVANVARKEPGGAESAAASRDKLSKFTYVDKGLADGEKYFYQITAYNEKDLESVFSSPMAASTAPAVSGVTAEGDMVREVRLSWNHIPAPFIRGYYVYRSSAEGGGFTRIKKIDAPPAQGEKVIYIDGEGIRDDIRYYYRITAFEDSEAETSPSATVYALTKGKPVAPSGFVATSGLVKKVDLRWQTSDAPDVVGYSIYFSQHKTGSYELLKKIDDRTTGAFIDERPGAEPLLDNAQFFYQIRSYNRAGVESEPSDIVAATTKARPTAPAGLQAEAFKLRAVPLSWRPNPEADVVAYHVYRSGDGADPMDRVNRIIGEVTGKAGGELSRIATVNGKTDYVDMGLKDGRSYRYQLQAEDRDGLLSDLSEAVGAQTKSKPRSPEGIAGTVRGGTVELLWEPVKGAAISHYTVYEKRFFALEKLGTVAETRFSGEGPAKGKSKTYVVTATDQDGLESDASREVTVSAK